MFTSRCDLSNKSYTKQPFSLIIAKGLCKEINGKVFAPADLWEGSFSKHSSSILMKKVDTRHLSAANVYYLLRDRYHFQGSECRNFQKGVNSPTESDTYTSFFPRILVFFSFLFVFFFKCFEEKKTTWASVFANPDFWPYNRQKEWS